MAHVPGPHDHHLGGLGVLEPGLGPDEPTEETSDRVRALAIKNAQQELMLKETAALMAQEQAAMESLQSDLAAERAQLEADKAAFARQRAALTQ